MHVHVHRKLSAFLKTFLFIVFIFKNSLFFQVVVVTTSPSLIQASLHWLMEEEEEAKERERVKLPATGLS